MRWHQGWASPLCAEGLPTRASADRGLPTDLRLEGLKLTWSLSHTLAEFRKGGMGLNLNSGISSPIYSFPVTDDSRQQVMGFRKKSVLGFFHSGESDDSLLG